MQPVRIRGLGFFLLLALMTPLLLPGCGARRDTVLLEDRFANPRYDWGSESEEAFDRGYSAGEYFIEVYEPNRLVWTHPGRRFQDVAVEVEAHRASGSSRGHFGLICRYRRPADFYYFAITDDGFYAILRVMDGEPKVLTGEGFLPSSAVQPEDGIYHIRAVCWGEVLSLLVNGSEVARVTDAALQRGDVGLAAGSGPDGAVRVHFDNLRVIRPTGEEGE